MSILIQSPTLGLNSLFAANTLDPRYAADCRNIRYENGLLQTDYGYAKVDLTSGLNNGDKILYIFGWQELDGTHHLIAVTTQKIYDHDAINNTWTDKSKNGLLYDSNITRPISYAVIPHNDTTIYLDDDATKSKSYHHVVICDGGFSNIQRWAGNNETDFADVVGGGGYHDGPAHRAWQVIQFMNRLVLISPQTYSSSDLAWTENNQTIQWPQIGKLESWSGAGSGSLTLVDTGGTNVRAALLGGQLIIYQTIGIWTINHVGGTTIFDPALSIPDIGLLGPHLLATRNNIHYFLATDYNVYAYYGGSIRQSIGDAIKDYLAEDIALFYENRCCLSLDKDGRRLWIFIVSGNNEYITKAYGYDLIEKSWRIRDFSNKYTTANSGIVAANLIGAQTCLVGESYTKALQKLSDYDASEAGDITQRYGDVLEGTAIALPYEWSNACWSEGGLFYEASSETEISQDISSNYIMRIVDGSKAINTFYGSRYFTIHSACSENPAVGEYSIHVEIEPRDTTGNAVADASTNVPADISSGNVLVFCATMEDYTSNEYRSVLDEIQTAERLCIGDSEGYIYQFNSDYSDFDAVDISAFHETPVFDLQNPDIMKIWTGISIVAKENNPGNGRIVVGYSVDDGSWNTKAFDLSSDFEEQTFYFHATGKRIQFRFDNTAGSDFVLREYKILSPQILDDR